MTVKIGINGFGRIGRCVLAHIVSSGRKDVEVVKINATGPLETSAHLMRYDSVHGRFDGEITVGDGTLDLGLGPIEMFSSYDPSTLDWSSVDVVLECTGNFNDGDKAKVHLARGAKKVLISAPAVNVDRTIVLGANEAALLPSDVMISNGSCTTNCLAPLAKVLNDAIGIERGIMTTIHSYTNDQNLIDNYHKADRRGRSAALNMVLTETGAAKAVAKVLPQLEGKLTGNAIRVPTPNVSIVDLTFTPKRDTSVEEVNALLKAASEGALKGVLAYSDEPLVSIDYNHCPASSTIDSLETAVIDGKLVRVLSWYDNEWGFSNRMVDTAGIIGKLL